MQKKYQKICKKKLQSKMMHNIKKYAKNMQRAKPICSTFKMQKICKKYAKNM